VGLPFGAFLTIVANIGGRPSKFGEYARCGGTFTIFGGVLSYIYIYLFILVTNPPWAFWGCHVAPSDLATWCPAIGPCCPVTFHVGMMSFPCWLSRMLPHGTSRGSHASVQTAQSPTTCLYRCHVIVQTSMSACHSTVQTSMWHDPIGPWISPKMPKLGDMWQPLVLPHHHSDISMTHVTFLLLPSFLYKC
jgi:hypothetical protein